MNGTLERVGGSPVLVWRFPTPLLVVATAPLGGGLGVRQWVINVEVDDGYGRTDPDRHAAEIAGVLGLCGDGVGMLTAARVEQVAEAEDGGVQVAATVGITHPIYAAAPDDDAVPAVGTINVVAVVPARLSPAAIVNSLVTVTEAKTQALHDADVDGTGTATDAVAVACSVTGPEEPFGGPRSRWGAPLARAVYAAVRAGAETQ